MDFILGLPKAPTREDSIWVVIDRLTKSAHFIPMKNKDPMDKLAICLEYSSSIWSTIGNYIGQRLSFYLKVLAKSLEGNGDRVEV